MIKATMSPATFNKERATAYAADSNNTLTTMSTAEEGKSVNVGRKPKTSSKVKTLKPVSSYVPEYSADEKETLARNTETVVREINRIIAESGRYGSVRFGSNVLIDLRHAVSNGVRIFGVAVNREHGKDQQTTGASVLTNGAQEYLIGITYVVAKAFGIDCRHLTNDADQTAEPSDGDIVLLDGHGRMNFLMSYPVDEWPEIYLHFPNKDAFGYYNVAKCLEVINTDRKQWGTPDFMQKRIVEEGIKTHKGWILINDMMKKGYKYQAACQLVTLKPDRITKREIIKGKANDIFAYYDYAVEIYEALRAKLGDGDDKTLKTKEFTKEITVLWGRLRDMKGNSWATEKLIGFIKGISEDTVAKILSARKTADGVTKDENRRRILDYEFEIFMKKQEASSVSNAVSLN